MTVYYTHTYVCDHTVCVTTMSDEDLPAKNTIHCLYTVYTHLVHALHIHRIHVHICMLLANLAHAIWPC